MKNSINKWVVMSIISGMFAVSCNTPKEKIEDAKVDMESATTDMKVATKDMQEAKDEYLADVEKYKNESNTQIAANEESIKEFNARIAGQKASAAKEYKEKIASLEKKNSDMKLKLDNAKTDSKENWEKFKKEFSHDMDELGNAFKDFTVKNVKK